MDAITEDGINYTIHGCDIHVLGMDEIILETDYVRQLFESNQEGGFDVSFKREGWCGLFWHTAEVELHGWIGKTYGDYLKFIRTDHDRKFNLTYEPYHEIIRII